MHLRLAIPTSRIDEVVGRHSLLSATPRPHCRFRDVETRSGANHDHICRTGRQRCGISDCNPLPEDVLMPFVHVNLDYLQPSVFVFAKCLLRTVLCDYEAHQDGLLTLQWREASRRAECSHHCGEGSLECGLESPARMQQSRTGHQSACQETDSSVTSSTHQI